MEFRLSDKAYGYLNPYIIAEIGVNHEGVLDNAKAMIRSAAKAGAHGVKFQSYKASTIASKKFSKSYWDLAEESTTSQYELFQKYDSFGKDEYVELAAFSKECNVDFLSTPFDLEFVDILDPLVPFFKIASADITNVPLLRKISSKQKPVVLSTGASTVDEIDFALGVLGDKANVCLLHCVLNYPTPVELANISFLNELREKYGNKCPIGYSDHVKPLPSTGRALDALLLATMLGAVVLEKHYTFNKSLPGNDHYHSMDEHDLFNFNEQLSDLRLLHGKGEKNLDLEEAARKNARRKICLSRDLKKGSVISESDIIPLRANKGIECNFWDDIIGKSLTEDLDAGVPIEWGFLG